MVSSEIILNHTASFELGSLSSKMISGLTECGFFTFIDKEILGLPRYVALDKRFGICVDDDSEHAVWIKWIEEVKQYYYWLSEQKQVRKLEETEEDDMQYIQEVFLYNER